MPKTKKLPEENKLKKTKPSQTRSKYIFAVGRRKRSVARINLYKGKGQIIINSQPVEKYFFGIAAKEIYLKPFLLTGSEDQFYATAKIVGGGKSSQIGAFVHGVARAFNKLDSQKYRPLMKKNGLLTRDPREKERRKPGYAQKARKRKQSPKR